MKLIVTLMLLSFQMSHLFSAEAFIYAGSYAKGEKAKGIHLLKFNLENGNLSLVSSEFSGENPSFLALHPNKKFLYAVNESGNRGDEDGGTLSAFQIDPNTGSLKLLNKKFTQGSWPCHLSLTKNGEMIAVANYGGGSVISYAIEKDGRLSQSKSYIKNHGSSINKKRQESAHAHSFNFLFNDTLALSADLGIDKIVAYNVHKNKAELTLNEEATISMKAGHGPRHIAFSQNEKNLYVINELTAVISSFIFNETDKKYNLVTEKSTLPKDYTGKKSTAEIVLHPNGQFLYGSNRGHDSIVVFNVFENGEMTKVQTTSVEGKTPRNFTISPDGKWVLVAHQDSNSIRVFSLNPTTGKLTLTDNQVSIPKPVCLIFK